MIKKHKIRTFLFMFALFAMLIALWTAGYGATSALAQTCSDGSTAKYFTSCFATGPITGTNATEPSIIVIDYGTNANKTTLATVEQVGSTWGMAYQDSTDYYYSSALLKMNTGLGPAGLGGVYVTDPSNPGTVVTSFDVATVCGVSVGMLSAPRDLTSGNETAIWDDIGKVGIGDIDIAGDTMYVTNLFTNQVHQIDISDPIAPSCNDSSSYAIPALTCPDGGTPRPWAVSSGSSAPGTGPYVGVVCDDASVAQVYDLNTGAGVYSSPIDMGYGGAFTASRSDEWQPWVATQAAWDSAATGGRRNYPQPIFSDIEFDPATGDLILGFMDRSGNQATFNYDVTSPVNGMSTSGDIIHSCYVGGVYYLEGDPNCPAPNTGAGIACPNGGNSDAANCEWYIADDLPEDNSFAGGLAIFPGSGELLFTESDPNGADSFGVGYASIMSGTANSEYTIGTGDWGKAAALGDIEIACAPADAPEPTTGVVTGTVQHAVDGDPVAGALVTLTVGTEVYTTTTVADGSYTFTGVMTGTGSIMVDPSSIPSTDDGDMDTNDKNPAGLVNPSDVTITAGETTAAEPATVPEVVTEPTTGIVTGTVQHETDGDPVAGALVTLTVGTEVYTTETGTDGSYTFTGVMTGTGTIMVDPSSIPSADGTDADPNDKNPDGLINPTDVVITAGETTAAEPATVPEVAPPLVLGEIGNMVMNVSGPGLDDVTVELYVGTTATGTPTQTTTTMSDGTYLFTNLPLGEYTVAILTDTLPATKDGSNVSDITVSLTDEMTSTETADFSVPDAVDENDPGQLTIVKEVVGANLPNPLPTFDIEVDDQDVAVSPGSPHVIMDIVAGTVINVDEPTLPSTDWAMSMSCGGASAVVENQAGGLDVTINDGQSATCTITNRYTEFVEPVGAVTGNISHVDGDPVPGATVNLVQNGTVVATTTTDAFGNYQFTDVPPGGGYTAEVVPGTVTIPDGDDMDGLDKDTSGIAPVSVPDVVADGISQAPVIDVPEPSSPEIRVVKTGSVGQANVGDVITYSYVVENVGDVPISDLTLVDDILGPITLDFGEDAAGTLGSLETAIGTATHIVTEADLASGDITNVARATGLAPDGTPVMDEDTWSVTVTEVGVELGSIGNAITNLDTGAPLQGVTVSLTGNGLLRSMETNASGMYLFENLPEGEYTITVDPTTLPDTKEVGEQPTSSTVMLGNGENNLDQDFAYPTAEILGSIGDRVFHADTNVPLAGVTVNLLDEDGNILQSVETDEFGMYMFSDLPLGTYSVEVDEATVMDKDPNNVGTAPTGPVVLTAEMPDVTDQDFSYGPAGMPLGSIGDMITNIDPNMPLAGVVVRLTWPSGAQQFATTGTDGMYMFDGLPAGEYTVEVLVGTLPEGKTAEGITSTMTVMLGEDEDYVDADFAYPSIEVTLGSIGDTIYNDDNENGMQDAGEPGLAGVIVSLSGPSGPMQTTTDADGMYMFNNLPMGDYTVIVDPSSLPDNKQGAENTGDPDEGAPNISSVTLSEMDTVDDLDQDFGYFLNEEKLFGSIGRIVFHDLNGNGVQDAGEPGLSGVEVILTDSDGMTVTQMTDGSGAYLFSGLDLGTYDVTVNAETLPLDKQTISADPDGNSDGTSTTTLSIDGQINDPDEDFGIAGEPPVFGSISRVIYHDINGNGIQDTDEPGLSGVRVTLTDAAGNVLNIVNTGTGGLYSFDGLTLDAEYNVTVDTATLPAGKQGAGNTGDPDDGNDSTSTLMLEADGTINDVMQNFGFQLLGSIGDFVYSVAPTGTIPLEGVMIELRDATGAVLETVETDAAGAYMFTGLPVGAEYTIEVDESTLPQEKQGKAPFYVLDSGDDSVVTVTLDSAETLIADFGYGAPTSVGLTGTNAMTRNVVLMLGVIVMMIGTAVIMTRRS